MSLDSGAAGHIGDMLSSRIPGGPEGVSRKAGGRAADRRPADPPTVLATAEGRTSILVQWGDCDSEASHLLVGYLLTQMAAETP